MASTRSLLHALLGLTVVVMCACGGGGGGSEPRAASPNSDPCGARIAITTTDAAPSLLIQDAHTDAIGSGALSGDDEVVATASADRTLRLFEARSGRVLRIVPHESMPYALTFLPREKAFFTATREGTARTIDVVSGDVKVLATVPHFGPTAASVAANGSRFALGSYLEDTQGSVLDPGLRQFKSDRREPEGHRIQVFESNGKLVTTLPVAVDQLDIALSPDGTTVAVATAGSIELWRVENATKVWSKAIKVPFAGPMLTFAPSGAIACSMREDKGLDHTEVLAAKDGRTVASVVGATLAITRDAIVTGSFEKGHVVYAFDASGKPRGRAVLSSQPRDVLFSKDGRELVVSDLAGGVHVLSVDGLRVLRERQFVATGKHRDDGVSLVGLSRSGLLTVGKSNGEIVFVDLTTLDTRNVVRADKASVTAIEFSPDGRRLAAGDEDHGITVWSLETGERLARVVVHDVEEIDSVAFASDGEIVQANGQSARVIATGAVAPAFSVTRRLTYGKATFIQSPDKRYAVNYGPYGVKVIDHGQEPLAAHGKDPPAWELPDSYGTGGADAAISRDGRLVVASRSPDVAVIDLAKKTPIATLEGHTDSVTSVRFSPGDRFLATGSNDGSVRVYRGRDLKPVVAFHLFKNDEWITTSPRGAYVSSREASVYVNWVFRAPLEAFGFDQFATKLARPDILKSRLAGEDGDVEWTHRPPQSRFVDDKPYVSTTKDSEEIVRVHVATGTRVRNVRAFVDGHMVAESLVCKSAADPELHVPLLPGKNRLTVVAYDQDGYSSAPLVRNVERSGGDGVRPNLHIVAIGINRYPGVPGKDLDVAVADARGITKAFKDHVGGLFAAVKTESVLLDDAATPASIRSALVPLATMGPADLALVFFAGHGLRDARGDAYFVTGTFNGKNLSASGVSWSDVRDRLSRAHGRVLMLVDACHSGSFAPEMVGPSGDIANEVGADGRAGAVVFAAAKGRQESLELGANNVSRSLVLEGAAAPATAAADTASIQGHGVFTGVVIEALAGAAPDVDGDGAIELGELESYVVRRVRDLTEGRQSPWIARREMIGDFAIAARARP